MTSGWLKAPGTSERTPLHRGVVRSPTSARERIRWSSRTYLPDDSDVALRASP
jgi:hypothetical protein